MLSDDQIIRRVLRGSARDYAELMQRHSGAVFRLAYRVLGSREEAEDAAQEAFVSAYNSLASCRDGGRFRHWLRRITLNICLKRLPRQAATVDLDDLDEAPATSGQSVEAEVIRQIESERLWRIINGLPHAYRVVLILKYQEDMKCAEIAEMLEQSVDLVYTQLHRARKMLAQRMAVVNDELS